MMNKGIRICIIGVYFGRLPENFQLWLLSCEHNPSIDFLIITDQLVDDFPINVQIIKSNIRDFKDLAEKKLGINIFLEYPYKLCDFKPVYGVILKDYLNSYDFWGHCDFDLIWGDIRHFIEKYKIDNYDKFLPLGHLSLFRNTDKCNNYYKLPGSERGSYKEVFTSAKHHSFTEVFGIYKIYKKNNIKFFTDRIFADISPIYKRFTMSTTIYRHIDKSQITKINNKRQIFYWEDGKVFRAYVRKGKIITEEYMYVHFQKRKLREILSDEYSWQSFYICPIGFVAKHKGIITIDDIDKYNHYSFWEDTFITIKYKINHFVNALIRRIH